MNASHLDILLVEDQASDAAMIRAALKASSIAYRLRHYPRGDELLNRLQSHVLPDLIMLDLGLPGMNGFDMLEELSKMATNIRSIPIVILTAYQNFEYIGDNFPLYIIDYMNKPCDAEQLAAILRNVQLSHSAIER